MEQNENIFAYFVPGIVLGDSKLIYFLRLNNEMSDDIIPT
jgi:hypothetical protein